MGPRRAPRRRRGGAYRGRAPLEPRPLAARRQSHRRQAALCPRFGGWHARYGGGGPLDRPEDEDGGRRPRLERARHYKPSRAPSEAGTRGGSLDAGGRGAERAAPAGERGGVGVRLLRMQRAQDAGTHGRGGALGPAGGSRGDGPVSRRGGDDSGGPPRSLYLERTG